MLQPPGHGPPNRKGPDQSGPIAPQIGVLTSPVLPLDPIYSGKPSYVDGLKDCRVEEFEVGTGQGCTPLVVQLVFAINASAAHC